VTPSLPIEPSQRRSIEAALLQLGAERNQLEQEAERNQQKVRALLQPARAAGITVREIAEMTGVSTQSLHTWHRELMQPIPAVHLGRIGPAPHDLTEAVLRTMGEDPDREWNAIELRTAIPPEWPTGSTHQVQLALGLLSRSLQIWQTDSGYRITPPPLEIEPAEPPVMKILQLVLDQRRREYAAQKAAAEAVLAEIEKLLPTDRNVYVRAERDDRSILVHSEREVASNLQRRIDAAASEHGYTTLFVTGPFD
jgi:AcrR family transcriptional regulator